MKTEVVITGIGVVDPHGNGWSHLFKKACLAGPVFDVISADQSRSGICPSIGLVKKIETEKYFTERQLRMLDKSIVMSIAATDLALLDAQFSEDLPRDDCAVLFSTVRSEHSSIYKFATPILEQKPRFLNGANFPLIARNISCGQVAISFGLRGMSSVLSSGPNASLQCLMRASQMIQSGRASVAIVGATESLSKFSISNSHYLYGDYFNASQPAFFGESLGQVIPSEGSCVFVLESLESAKQRNVQPYAKVDGYFSGKTGDQPLEKGIHEGLNMFLAKIKSSWAKIGLISSANSGTNQSKNGAEYRAFINFIQTEKSNPFITSARATFGESESCVTALQVAVAIQALRSNEILPTWHVAEEAPDALNIVRKAEKLVTGSSLVSGIDIKGNYCFLQFSRV